MTDSRTSRRLLQRIPRGVAYLLLVAGAAVFSFPFLWMASTSVKVDREVQTERLHLLPLTPIPQPQSPYVDQHFFDDLTRPFQDRLLPELEKVVRDSGFEIPATVNRELATQQIARGLYDRLHRRLPPQVWQGRRQSADGAWDVSVDVASTVLEAARREATPQALAEIFDRIYRRLLLGAIRIRTDDQVEYVLGSGPEAGGGQATSGGQASGGPDSGPFTSAGAVADGAIPVAERLANQTPQAARLEEVAEDSQPYALVEYDLRAADRVVLASTFTVPDAVDLTKLHRVLVPLRPDDTWHELWLTVEAAGKRYESVRAAPLANFEPLTQIWQMQGPDDESLTKIKTWTRLQPAGLAAASLAPNQIRLTLELRKVGQAGAWWNKISGNYRAVLDYIPFWRYLRVSLFLVIANVVLTVLFSSLAAYGFARLNWPGRDLCFILMLATMMIPSEVVMIPSFLIWKSLGAYNTLTPLWLGAAFGNAFFIFLLRQFMKGIPGQSHLILVEEAGGARCLSYMRK